MSPPDPLQWHRDERDSLVRQIEGLESGQIRSRQRVDDVVIDTSPDQLRDLRARLAKLEVFLGNQPKPKIKT